MCISILLQVRKVLPLKSFLVCCRIVNQHRVLGVRVIFEQEALDKADTDSTLMITIIESIAQVENNNPSTMS